MKILQLNIQSIRNKLLELEQFCNLENIDIICVSEHWLVSEEVDLYTPQGFLPASFYCRNNKKNGGTGIFIKSDIKYKVLKVEKFCKEMDCEICCIKLIDLNIVIVSVYRSPQGNIETFFRNFEQVMKHITSNSDTLITVSGDFNIEMALLHDHKAVTFSNLLKSLNLKCTVKAPTHHMSCIDNILVNFVDSLYTIKSFDGCFADHNSHVLEVYSNKYSQKSSNSNITNKTFVRKQSENEINLFIDLLKVENWEMVNDFNSGKSTVEELFNNFLKCYINLWHYCSPLINKSNKGKNKSKRVQWYNQHLAQERDFMLNLNNIYKNLRNKGSEQAELAHKTYLGCKRNYRASLKNAKRQACERYIYKDTILQIYKDYIILYIVLNLRTLINIINKYYSF